MGLSEDNPTTSLGQSIYEVAKALNVSRASWYFQVWLKLIKQMPFPHVGKGLLKLIQNRQRMCTFIC